MVVGREGVWVAGVEWGGVWGGEECVCGLVGWRVEFEGLDEGVGTKVGFSEEEHSMVVSMEY